MARRRALSLTALVSATLAALLAISIATAPAATGANKFTDVPAWAQFHDEITWLANKGITTGYADNTFRPHNAITRDAMAAFMYRLAGKPSFTAPSTSPFSDVTPHVKVLQRDHVAGVDGRVDRLDGRQHLPPLRARQP